MNNHPPPEFTSFWNLSPDETIPGPPDAWFHYWAEKAGYITEPKAITTRAGKARLFLITLSPKPKGVSAKVGILHSYVKRRLNKKWITNYWYCFELTKQGNPHVHIMVSTNKDMRSSDVLKGFKLPETNGHVRIQDTVTKGLKYLEGMKGGQPKPMHEADILFRKKFKLLSIYTNVKQDAGPEDPGSGSCSQSSYEQATSGP